jgi:SAM-dependent methyltransferase
LEHLDSFVQLARKMIQEGVVIAPWLTWDEGRHRIPPHLLHDMDLKAIRFADRYWHPDWKVNLPGGFPISKGRAAEAYHETVSATAVYLSHLELGTLAVTEEMVHVAERLTENFVETVGPHAFVSFYLLTMIYENLQALHYYGFLHTDDFLNGAFHRPWGTRTLGMELQAMIAAGMVEVESHTTHVRLTPFGKEMLRTVERLFAESDYLRFRSRLIRLNQFNHVGDMGSIMRTIFPHVHQDRRSVLEQSQIQPGMHVLELGCGTGELTFEAGLFQAVGTGGRLVATDPSMSMLAGVRRKRETYHANWVEVVRAKAESLPFPDDTFDSAIGFAFLHFTNLDEALREIARVLKPGGTLTTLHPLHFPAQRAFFFEWFEPLLRGGQPAMPPDILPAPHTVPEAMEPYFEIVHLERLDGEAHYTSPGTVVEFFVDIANVFEEQTSSLPWRARQDLIQELIRRGEDVCRKYPPDALVEKHPGQLIRAVVKK